MSIGGKKYKQKSVYFGPVSLLEILEFVSGACIEFQMLKFSYVSPEFPVPSMLEFISENFIHAEFLECSVS